MTAPVVDSRTGEVTDVFQSGPVFVVALIFTIFVTLLFLMIIILLNFLVAVISQTYENVMTTRSSTIYLHEAELNRECRLFLKSFFLDNRITQFILTCDPSNDAEAGEWEGFINTIKSSVQYEHKINKKRIENLRTYIQEDMAVQIDTKMGKLVDEFRYEFKELRVKANGKK